MRIAEIALKLRRDEGQDFLKIKLQFFKVKAKGYYMLLEQLVDLDCLVKNLGRITEVLSLI